MFFTIRDGDTLWATAQNHSVSVEALLVANPGIDPANLQICQVIILPDCDRSAAAPFLGDEYILYNGPAAAFPPPSRWASYDTLWTQNSHLMKFNSSDAEIELIKSAIDTVSHESGVDPRVILCIIVQESGGNPRVPTTDNGVRNPGLMQSHNGVEFDSCDPTRSILQMVRDGTQGTQDGDGLEQCFARFGNWHAAFRAYNSGSVNESELNDPIGATASYVRDAANRLMGHTWPSM